MKRSKHDIPVRGYVNLTMKHTRFAENGQSLLYANIPGVGWSFFHMDTESHIRPARVGDIYRSEKELLADLNRYAKSWGF